MYSCMYVFVCMYIRMHDALYCYKHMDVEVSLGIFIIFNFNFVHTSCTNSLESISDLYVLGIADKC